MTERRQKLAEVVRSAIRQEWPDTLRELHRRTKIAENTLSMFRSGRHKGMEPDDLIALCRALGIDANTGRPFKKDDAQLPPDESISFNLFGDVHAGPPSDPGETVLVHDETETITLNVSCWRSLFPRVDYRGLYALRVSGSSMQPRFWNGDLIFVRRTEERSQATDGRMVVVQIPGEGMTFKVWRESGVLESVNRDVFPPRVCPKNAKLWGIVICGTRMA